MEIKFNVSGERRKELARAVSEIIDQPMNYKGAPTFAYELKSFWKTKELLSRKFWLRSR